MKDNSLKQLEKIYGIASSATNLSASNSSAISIKRKNNLLVLQEKEQNKLTEPEEPKAKKSQKVLVHAPKLE